MKKLISCTLIIFLTLLISGCKNNKSERPNLLVNGDAEMPAHDSVPAGWLNIQGHWISPEGDSASNICSFAQNGHYLFFAGNDTLGILQQDIDVGAYASAIDARKQSFIFNGYVQSLDQGPESDQAQIIVTALDGSKNKIEYTYNSDSTRWLNKWQLLTDTFAAPVNTRFIRVQLISIRHVGGDNDGYFDNISLVAVDRALNKWLLLIIIAAAISIAIGIHGILKRKRKAAPSL